MKVKKLRRPMRQCLKVTLPILLRPPARKARELNSKMKIQNLGKAKKTRKTKKAFSHRTRSIKR
jgi:hypothetical protein